MFVRIWTRNRWRRLLSGLTRPAMRSSTSRSSATWWPRGATAGGTSWRPRLRPGTRWTGPGPPASPRRTRRQSPRETANRTELSMSAYHHHHNANFNPWAFSNHISLFSETIYEFFIINKFSFLIFILFKTNDELPSIFHVPCNTFSFSLTEITLSHLLFSWNWTSKSNNFSTYKVCHLTAS